MRGILSCPKIKAMGRTFQPWLFLETVTYLVWVFIFIQADLFLQVHFPLPIQCILSAKFYINSCRAYFKWLIRPVVKLKMAKPRETGALCMVHMAFIGSFVCHFEIFHTWYIYSTKYGIHNLLIQGWMPIVLKHFLGYKIQFNDSIRS